MQLTIGKLCLLIAVILFIAAAIGVDFRGISLVTAGLAFFAASFLVPDRILGMRR
jgi:hypothetical protein